MRLYALGPRGCLYLTLAKWKNLKTLIIGIVIIYQGFDKIGDEGCMHLSKCKWDNLTNLDLCLFIFK